jgi:hypothetical protein
MVNVPANSTLGFRAMMPQMPFTIDQRNDLTLAGATDELKLPRFTGQDATAFTYCAGLAAQF